MLRTKLHADPTGVFLHDAVLSACHKFSNKTALVDTSCIGPARRVSYGEFAELLEITAKNLVATGIRPGEVVAIYMPNCWEYAVSYHAITLAGAVPTLLNPSYREREARYQLENSGAVALITDGLQIAEVNLGGLPKLRLVFTTRHAAPGARHFSELQRPSSATLPKIETSPASTLGALPFSSGTTGMPKGVMLTHHNLLANAYQTLAPGEKATPDENDVALCFLPLYHIYGLNVILNPFLLVGASIVLMARFEMERALGLFVSEEISYLPLVPPLMNGFCVAAEQGNFPKNHCIRTVKSGAAPLAPELPKRFTNLTGIPVRQGYGMTEASPVTHLGFLEPDLYRPDSIGPAVAQTDCRLVDETGTDVPIGEPGELVMRGPQFMQGYFNAPEVTREVLRDGWYWSGDIAVRDEAGFYKIVDRRKEMIKCKGFPVAPAEVEAVLLEHPAVRDCGVIGKPDDCAGEVPCAFIVLRENILASAKLETELCGYVGERLCSFKQPRSVRFVDTIPRNPSGKILRKDLRTQL
ncbi:MAG: AMP-dependent synthetase and ligase [Acidobacteriaceae bacterium]|nr:AMP-dependent synthetase and ligase [Acidobacteriaceae bacterium]